MKHISALVVFAVVVAACGQDSTVIAPPVGESAIVGPTTTTIVKIATPSTSATPTTSTTTVAAPSTTSTTMTTTTTESPSTTIPADPEIITGTFYPTGTSIPIEIPEGAIGPSERIAGESGRLIDLIGVPTYRMRTTFTAPGLAGGEDTGEYVIETDVIEGANEDSVTLHARWVSPNTSDRGDPIFEVLLIDDRQYRREQGGEWTEDTGGAIFGLYTPPIVYSMLDGFSSWITASEWLGNEEIDGVPVGWYRPFPFEDSFSSSEPEINTFLEFWIDADGVVRRGASDTFIEGELWWSFDAVLYDVGADIVIEAPLVP